VSAVVLFDGVCNLCSGSVRFIVERDRDAYFQFASLQSDVGRRLLAEQGLPVPEGDPASIILIENGHLYDRSTAILRIARKLHGIWKAGWAFVIVPRPIRDLVYGFIAKRRYRWFGKKDACMVPTPELRARFLG
jgi:predicted DCC family thiol-disulfide oxidoreductase YuxK